MSGTIYTEQGVLGHTLGFAPMAFPARVYVGLCSAAMPPSETVHGVEAFGNGYARQQAQFALIDTPANIAANVATVEYPMASGGWGTLGFFELWDAPVGGNRLYWGALIDTASQLPITITVAAGDIVRFSAGTLAVQATTGAGGTSTVGAYLPLGGGILTGPLLLAADPTTYLQAATKQYVDAHSGTGGGPGFLPLSGGTMLGMLTLSGPPTSGLHGATKAYVDSGGSAPFLPLSGGAMTATLATAAAGATPILATTWNVNNADGVATTVQFSTQNNININSPAGQSIWGNSDSLGYHSPTPSTTGASYVARRAVTVAYTDRGTVPNSAPGLWAGIFDIVDLTGHNSSIAGQMLALEVDVEADGLDDGNCRQGLVVVGATRNYPTAPSSEFSRGIGLFSGDAGVTFKDMITLSTRFNRAGINMSTAVSVGGVPAIWLADGHRLAWNTAGTVNAYWDTAAFSGSGGVHYSSNIEIDGSIFTPNGITVGGLAALAGGASITGTATANTAQIGGISGPTWTTGSAAPAATAPVGSLYSRVGGAVGATLYVSRGAGAWAAVAGV